MSRTLPGLFLVGALNRPRKRKGTNRENPRPIPEQIGKIPEKSGKSQKGQKRKDKSRSGSPPRLKHPRLAALDIWVEEPLANPENLSSLTSKGCFYFRITSNRSSLQGLQKCCRSFFSWSRGIRHGVLWNFRWNFAVPLFEGAQTVKCKPWTERVVEKGLSRGVSRAAWKRRINRELEAKKAHRPWIREGLNREVQTVN